MVEQKTSPNGAGNPPANPSSRARQHRLLEIRENLPARTTAKTATPAVAGSLEGEAKPNSQGGELNDFIRQLVDRREQRRHQLEIIQDFFGFGEEIRPRYRLYIGYEFIHRLWLLGGIDHVFLPNRRDYFLGLQLRFTDEDLKTILPFSGGANAAAAR